MGSNSRFVFQRGDTFALSGVVNVNGAVEDMTGWTIAAEVRVRTSTGAVGDLISTLTASWSNPVTATLLLTDTSTSSWALGEAYIDVRLTSPGSVRTTTTKQRFIIEDPATQSA
jgi:hypothetical protein